VKAGLFVTTNFTALGWTTELHNNTKNSPLGVLAFLDGHVEANQMKQITSVFQRQSIATNRLVIP
jgi:prepilin-type processing-associated H-X9-DG protein